MYYSFGQISEGKTLDENIFDYQCALWSIPQYLYQDLDSFKKESFDLVQIKEIVFL